MPRTSQDLVLRTVYLSKAEDKRIGEIARGAAKSKNDVIRFILASEMRINAFTQKERAKLRRKLKMPE